MGKIFYLMGKSASGKDHIYEYLKQQEALELHVRSGKENRTEESTFLRMRKNWKNSGKVIRL